ncbi:helix-turn-helix transcriptional regulator [Micromonospora sp. NBC_01813]|uniref:helix-turn-helix transcriptional regulator n=1 Tax=Micromonospora sp. NBC_01813 TaxID=2975988 RepID=UPI002DDAD7C5|nr:LuxR family transcriptional regulator [Micromonospora sp. NBC_01813]WSA07717.1 LuxR family transcriptional regulator [Micromonospora sp. NBC_01813]
MQRKQALAGRQTQLAALDEALRQASTGGRFALVTGAAGSGRTALLDAASDGWRAVGAAVLRVPPQQHGGGTVDGFAALLDVLRDQYGQLANPLLAGPLSAMDALCGDAGSPAPGRLAVLAQETSAAFGLIGRKVATVLVADDADDAPWIVPALAAAVRDNCLVVAASRAGTGRLAALADLVTELTPLDTAVVREMLTRRHGVPVDEAVLPVLGAALGPLAGNPATVLQTTAELARARRLAVVGGHLCLLDPQTPIPLAPEHRLVTAARRRGVVAVRLATMAAVTRFHVDDLPLFADATLGRVDTAGQILDGLVADGVLVVEPDDVVSPSCPALAARLVADAGTGAVTRLHRAYAAAMLRRSGSGVPADRATLADHVTSAGGTLPTDRRTASALVATATEAMEREPDRAADWLGAALRHSGGGPAGEDILARLLRLLVRTGQFARLGEVVRAVPAAGRADLAAAGVLAALHTGAPVGGVLREPPEGWTVPAMVDRWLTATPDPVDLPVGTASEGGTAPLVADAEFALVGRACGTDPLPAADPLLVAGAAGDLAEVFQLVLGDGRYRVPNDGPLAAYHRMLLCRARGDLPGVVSAARQVGLTGGQAPVPRRLARLWAAESLALRGRSEEASAWLASVPDEPPYAALRWWVANGPAGEPATVAEAARRLDAAYRVCQLQLRYGSRIGLDRLLGRAVGIAARFGLAARGAEIARLVDVDVADRRPDTGSVVDRGTIGVVRALMAADLPAAAEAVDVIRTRGDRVGLGYAALDLGRVVGDPLQWLLAALDTAEEIGAPWLRAAAAEAMRARGIRRPRGRTPRTALSPVETQIIELIRYGRTNRQIAVTIRMSEKTVENYLTRLFARTGCRSRVELAAASITSDTLDLAS